MCAPKGLERAHPRRNEGTGGLVCSMRVSWDSPWELTVKVVHTRDVHLLLLLDAAQATNLVHASARSDCVLRVVVLRVTIRGTLQWLLEGTP
jgi:hypothetical protein